MRFSLTDGYNEFFSYKRLQCVFLLQTVTMRFSLTDGYNAFAGQMQELCTKQEIQPHPLAPCSRLVFPEHRPRVKF